MTDANSGEFLPHRGAIHIHTDHSDGGIDVPRVIAAAHDAGLDFIVITDHNTVSAREHAGYHDNLLVVVDVEISPSPFRHHLIALGLEEYEDLHRLHCPDRILDAVKEAGALAWVPHPRGFLNPWCAVYNAPWPIWDERIDGLELGTFLVEWVESLRPWNLPRRFRDPASGVGNLDPRLLARWDRLNLARSPDRRPVAGFVGIDAHYRETLGGWLRTPSYEYLFRTHHLVAWTAPRSGDGEGDTAALYEALAAARFTNVLGHRGPPAGFWLEARGRSVRAIGPAGSHPAVRLLAGGTEQAVRHGSDVTFDGLPRAWHRTEFWLGSDQWAISNPVAPGSGKAGAVATPGTLGGVARTS